MAKTTRSTGAFVMRTAQRGSVKIRVWAVGLTVAVVTALAAPAAAPAASENAVLDWYRYAGQEVNQAAQMRNQPQRARLEMAMVQGAVYDAVNAIARTNQPYLVAPRARRWYSKRAAAATAAYRMVIALLPDRQPALEPLYQQSLAATPDGAAKTGGIRVGNRAAEAMLAARASDGRDGPRQTVFGTQPGVWRPTPPAFAVAPSAWIGDVMPFLIPSAERLRTRGPNRLTSGVYAKDFNETKELGAADSTTRTPEQTEIALYWDQAPWDAVIVSLAQRQNLNTNDTARLLAMVSLAGADASIAVTSEKNYWNTWRPITAIQEADYDGNPATTPDPDWTPLIETPGFPEYPAGHTAGSGAIVGALQSFFGTDRIAFSAYSPSSGTTRSFTSFSQALQEVIDSRVWGGIHWRTADVVGARIGKRIARWERSRYFKPVQKG
jgi:PAP2 superfamily